MNFPLWIISDLNLFTLKKIIWLKYVEIMQQESEKMNPIKPETAVISSPQAVFGFYHFPTIPIDSPGMVVP